MGIIVNINDPQNYYAAILNQSNIGGATQNPMPPGWKEIDGYKEHFLRDDTAAVRIFEGPWRTRQAFYLWALGYTQSFGSAAAAAGGQVVLGGGGGIVNNQLPPANAGIIDNNPGSGAVLSRQVPAQHPEFPWLYCTGAELLRGQGAIRNNPTVVLRDAIGKPVENPADAEESVFHIPMIEYYDSATPGTGTSLSAVVALTYRNLDYEVRTDAELQGIAQNQGELERYVIREQDASAGFLPLPSGAIQWVANAASKDSNVQTGALIPQNAATVILFQEELTYIWLDVPDPPLYAIANCTGKINSALFDGARGWPVQYAPTTLLCQPAKRRRHRSGTGRISWDITYRFLFKPTGWLTLPAADGAYWAVQWAKPPNNTAPCPYASADFNTLFQPPQPVTYQ